MWYVLIRLLIFPSYSKGRMSPTLFCTLLLFECIYYFFHWLDFLSHPHLLPFLLLLGLHLSVCLLAIFPGHCVILTLLQSKLRLSNAPWEIKAISGWLICILLVSVIATSPAFLCITHGNDSVTGVIACPVLTVIPQPSVFLNAILKLCILF